MDLLQVLKSRDGTIVVVDDHFAEPDVTHLDASDLTRFHRYLSDNSDALSRVARLIGLEGSPIPSEVVAKAEADAPHLWLCYRANESAYAELASLFATIKLQHEGETQKLRLLVEFCQNELQVNPATFSSLADAATTLNDCVIAFVDFYLKAGVSGQAAIAEHTNFRNQYRQRYSHNEARWPKIVFLVSSKLPGRDQLQEFRAATGLRSAFFLPLRKGDLTVEVLRSHLAQWFAHYAATAQLDNYLTEMSLAVQDCSKSLIADIERLELHDLTMLDTLKLSAERESLQGYLTWVLSESLASKVRSSPSLQKSLLPKEEALTLLDGKLMPGSVLFELFSDIAVSPISNDDSRPAFGDIYASQNQAGDATQNEWLLAITPACDLIRCSPEDSVLCVRGALTKADPNMEVLLTKKSLFGKGSHVIRYRTEGQSEYAHIKWMLKRGLVTLPAKLLMSTEEYKKVARLSELFAQEVKELVLGEVSRVGIPIDTVFSVAGTVAVRINFIVGKDEDPIVMERDLSDKDFISAVITKGRLDGTEDDSQEFLVFTQQFSEWLKTEFFPAVRENFRKYPAKLEAVEKFFGEWTAWHVLLNNQRMKTECGGSLSFKYGSSETPCANNRMEIIVSGQ